MPPHIEDLNDWKVSEWPTTPEGEERQAREITEMYEILFAHPAVKAITTWSGIDGRWLNAPAGLLRKDNSEKPAFHALKDKSKGEWWTREEFRTDANGEFFLEGFRGTYEVLAGDMKAAFVLDGNDNHINLVLGGT
jgi:hypothetical protein